MADKKPQVVMRGPYPYDAPIFSVAAAKSGDLNEDGEWEWNWKVCHAGITFADAIKLYEECIGYTHVEMSVAGYIITPGDKLPE